MKTLKTLTLTLILFAQAYALSAESTSTKDKLNAVGDANWSISENELKADSGRGYLVTKETYGDFYLKVEFQAAPQTNSGIFFRCSDPVNINTQNCYEANIYDTAPDQNLRTGALVGLATPKAIMATEDKAWHTYEIIAVGDQIRVLLDHQETVYVRNQKHNAGYMALQFAQGEIKFRNLNIRTLSPEALKNTKTVLDGVWELESFAIIDSTGKSTPWCVGSFGVIMYTNNYMSTAVNCTSDPNKTVFYAGPFKIKGQTVLHRAQNFSHPSLNKVFSRDFHLTDPNHLELTGTLGGNTVLVKWVRR